MRDAIHINFALHAPMFTHGVDAIKLFSFVIIANKTTVWFYRKCESFFNGHIIDRYSSGECRGTYAPMLAHGFYISEDITFVITAWFVIK